MTFKTLVVGTAEGSLGERIATRLMMSRERERRIFCPGMDEMDVTKPLTIQKYINDHGPFDEIVYAAGINYIHPVPGIAYGLITKHFEVNVNGFVFLAGIQDAVFPNVDVDCVVIVSDAAHTPMRHSVAYCASKAAALMAVRVMAREMPHWHINAVSPGVISGTPMTELIDREVRLMRGWDEEEAMDYEMASNPLGRRVTKDEVADVVLSLLTGPQSQRGSNIIINGGK